MIECKAGEKKKRKDKKRGVVLFKQKEGGKKWIKKDRGKELDVNEK